LISLPTSVLASPIVGTVPAFVDYLSGGLQEGRVFATEGEAVAGRPDEQLHRLSRREHVEGQLVQAGKVAGELFGTHEFRLHDMMSAYETFANAAETNALKVVITR